MTLKRSQGIPVVHVSFEKQSGEPWFSRDAYAPWLHHLRGVFFEYLMPISDNSDSTNNHPLLENFCGDVFRVKSESLSPTSLIFTRQATRDSLYVKIAFPSLYTPLADYLSCVFSSALQFKHKGEQWKHDAMIDHGNEVILQFQKEYPDIEIHIGHAGHGKNAAFSISFSSQRNILHSEVL